MNLVAFDPGPTTCGYCIVRLDAARATFITGGLATTRERLAELSREVDAMAIEVVRGPIFTPQRGPAIIATSRTAGFLECLARDRRMHLVERTAREVRLSLCGRGNASDGQVADAVRGNVFGFPAKSNVHIRDAAALAVVAAWEIAGCIGERVPQPRRRRLPA